MCAPTAVSATSASARYLMQLLAVEIRDDIYDNNNDNNDDDNNDDDHDSNDDVR